MNQAPALLHLLLTLHAEGPMTTHELADFTDRNQQRVKKAINESRQRYGSAVFRVESWDLHRGVPGPPSPRFAPGPGRDVPRPAAEDERSVWRRSWERSKVKRALHKRMKRAARRAQPFDGLLPRILQKSFS